VHYPDGKLRDEDIQRQQVLERAGWRVFRVHSRAFYRDPESALAHVLDYFGTDEVPETEVKIPVYVDKITHPDQISEGIFQIAQTAMEHERVDLTKIPISQIQEVLRSVAPDPGLEIQRDELFHRALPYFSLCRLGRRVRERFQSALNGLIRRKEFGYRGRDVVWRLKPIKNFDSENACSL
jgi:hypothetical protein